MGDDVRVLVTGPDNTSFTLLITGPGTPSTTELMTGRFTSFVEDSFTPDAAGTWFFRAPFSALGEATGTLEVAGEARPALAVDTIDFGDVLVGNQESRTVSVTNTGDAAVDLVTYAVRGTGFSPRIANLGSIPAGGSASATVNFEPPARGEFPGLIDVEGNAGSKAVRAQAVVRGTGVASDLTFTPTPVAFGEVCVDQTETISVDMQNVGDFDLTQVTLAGLDAPFGISSVPGALPLNMGQLFRVTASFAPSEEGSFEDSLVATAQFNYRGRARLSPADLRPVPHRRGGPVRLPAGHRDRRFRKLRPRVGGHSGVSDHSRHEHGECAPGKRDLFGDSKVWRSVFSPERSKPRRYPPRRHRFRGGHLQPNGAAAI